MTDKKSEIPKICATCEHLQPKAGPFVLNIPRPPASNLALTKQQIPVEHLPLCLCGNPQSIRYGIVQSPHATCSDYQESENMPEFEKQAVTITKGT
jgi:hypothetical protein